MNTNNKSSLGDLLLILRRNIAEVIKKEGLKQELTFSQVEVLNFVGPHSRKTMKNIAEYLKITPPSATEVVAEMEKKGLVKRMNDRSDRRVIYIIFTGTAKKIYTSICRRKELVLKKMINKLNVRDQKDLERIIRILLA